jgi:hypothetical protein
MLSSLFQEWLQYFEREVAKKHGGRNVLLFVDNCPCHKLTGLVLPHVNVHFFPPNTTAKIQPMDAGIIMAFKRHYRRYQIS